MPYSFNKVSAFTVGRPVASRHSQTWAGYASFEAVTTNSIKSSCSKELASPGVV